MTAADLSGRVAVVSGATGGIGSVIAAELAKVGAHVVAIVRDPARGAALQSAIRSGGAGSIEFVKADLSCRADVQSAARVISDRHEAVHVLVNNAGAHYSRHSVSADGVEMHIAVDYLAAFGLTALLEPSLGRGKARVVNVASDTLRDARQLRIGPARPPVIDLDSLDDLSALNPRQGFVPFQAYGRAKLLTVMAGYAAASSLASEGVRVNSVHPGIVGTAIVDELLPSGFGWAGGALRKALLTPEEGASAVIRLAADPALEKVTGKYFVRERETRTPPISYDEGALARLSRSSRRHFEIDG